MLKAKSDKAPRKSRFSQLMPRIRLCRVKKQRGSFWFFHPEMQARIVEAEADLLNGRSYRTDSAESAQALLDSWKR